MVSSVSGQRWEAVSRDICSRYWNGEDLSIVFNPATGHTHLITRVAAEVLALIQCKHDGVTIEELVTEFSPASAADQDAFSEIVEKTLLELANFDLVARAKFESR